MSKRLLITGANGFVGSNLVERATEKGYDVFAAVRKNSDLSALKNTKATLVYPDYFNQEKLVQLLSDTGITHIAHVAGITKARTENDYYKINARLSLDLANAALLANKELKKFVFVSSLAAMGPTFNKNVITEETHPHPITYYGQSKLAGEEELSKIESLPLISLRPTAVYGPREKDLLMLIKMIKKGWELYIGKAPQELSFIHVYDLCDAILLSLESSKNHEAYILSDGINYNRYAFADIVKETLNTKTIKLHIPAGLVKTAVTGMEKMFPHRNSILNKNKLLELTSGWGVSLKKAENELDYYPKFDLKKGLKQTIEWLKTERWI
ncbi:MAG: NAD(P)-dependent oxidoreductase [Arachidicoccus sp.]|nr:NAD(P)-dependent oxidoreductase [Arachidicoccus sp.]